MLHNNFRPNLTYKETQFTRQDYHRLYDIASPDSTLRSRLHTTKFRDKRFQRSLKDKEAEVLYCTFNQLGMYINSCVPAIQDILKWRLSIHK